MPEIKQINDGKLGLEPTERGIDAFAQAGRRIGVFYNQAAEDQRKTGTAIAGAIETGGKTAVDYLDHQQISAGMKNYSALDAQLTQAWDSTLKGADHNDPTVAAKFQEGTVEPALEKFQEGFMTENGQQWAEKRGEDLRVHFAKKTVADQSTLAMVAARENIRDMTNSYSTKVAIDPASLPDTLAQAQKDFSAFVDSSPTLTAEHRARLYDEIGPKINETIVKAGITAAIAKNPDAGLQMAQDPQFAKYLNGGEVNAFYTEAKRAAKADAVNARQLQEQQLKQTSEKNSEDILQDIHSGDPKITAQHILQLPADQLTYERRKDLVNAIEKRDHAPANAQAEAGKLIMDIHAGKVRSEDEIVKALGDGKIDYPRYKEVRKEFEDLKAPGGETLKDARSSFLKQYDGVVNPSPPGVGRSEAGFKRSYQLQQYAVEQEEAMRAKGDDPRKLYDPRAPEFIGNSPYAKPTASADLLRRGGSMGPPKPAPPREYPDATFGKDGKYHVIRDGKSYTVMP